MYKYITKDNLEQTQNYMYTEYGGEAFLHEYMISRREYLYRQQNGVQADFDQLAEGVSGWLFNKIQLAHQALTVGLLRDAGKDALDFLLKVFELRKRIYTEYPCGYKPKEDSGYREFGRYLLFGQLISQAYTLTGNMKYLNTLLKLDDTLISLEIQMKDTEKACVCSLLRVEMQAVKNIITKQGVSLRGDGICT